jgi:hypothetical protein
MEQETVTKEYTPEELDALQAEQESLLDKQIAYFEKLKAFETLKAEIEEARFRQARASMGIAQILAPSQEEGPTAPDPQPRKLKKD